MRKFVLNMKERADGVLPYPYIVNEQGFVMPTPVNYREIMEKKPYEE